MSDTEKQPPSIAPSASERPTPSFPGQHSGPDRRAKNRPQVARLENERRKNLQKTGPQAGEVVRYSVGDKKYNALVLNSHTNIPDHLGKNGEPLLHLAFVAPDRESEVERAKPGYMPQVFTDFDVVHASQEFSEEYKLKHGLLTAAAVQTERGGAEWSELQPLTPKAQAKSPLTPANERRTHQIPRADLPFGERRRNQSARAETAGHTATGWGDNQIAKDLANRRPGRDIDGRPL